MKFKGIYKKGKIWYIDKVINKTRINRSLNTTHKDDAVIRAKALTDEAQQLKWSKLSSIKSRNSKRYATLKELFESFKAYASHENLSPVSVNSYIKRYSLIFRIGKIRSYPRKEYNPSKTCTSELTEELVLNFQEGYKESRKVSELANGPVAQRRTLRSCNTALRNAKALFTKRAMAWYKKKGLNLPDIKGFKDVPLFRVKDHQYTLPPELLRTNTPVHGRLLKQDRPDLYIVFILAYDLGMRASEIMNCKMSWINKSNSGRWQMDINTTPDYKPKWGRERSVPMTDEIYQQIKEYSGDNKYIIPGNNPTDRRNLVWTKFSRWMRGIGWDKERYPKAAHELRKLIGSKWFSMPEIGPVAAQEWLGHTSLNTTCKYYARLAVDIAPIGELS